MILNFCVAAFLFVVSAAMNVNIPQVPINPAQFSQHHSLNDGVDLYWSIFNNDVLIVGLSCPGTGWCALGPSPKGRMIGSDVFAGWVTDEGVPQVWDIKITQKNTGCPGVCNDTNADIGGEYNVLNFTGGIQEGKTELIWARKFVTGDVAGDYDIEIGGQIAVYAFNPTVKELKSKHTRAYSIHIDWESGSVTNTVDIALAHGILMFFAWLVVVPFSILVARFLRSYTWWFPTHWGCLTFGIVLIIVAFALAVNNTSEHFKEKHQIIGLVLFLEVVLQAFLGVIADRMYDPERTSVPIFPDRIHQANGLLIFFLATINIYFGIELYNRHPILLDLYPAYWGVVLALVIIGYVAYGIWEAFFKSKQGYKQLEADE